MITLAERRRLLEEEGPHDKILSLADYERLRIYEEEWPRSWARGWSGSLANILAAVILISVIFFVGACVLLSFTDAPDH